MSKSLHLNTMEEADAPLTVLPAAHVVHLPPFGVDAAWRAAARRLLLAGVVPDAVSWQISLEASAHGSEATVRLRVPQTFLALANTVVWHRRPERFDLLYRLLWRLRREPALLEQGMDPAIAGLRGMERSVQKCLASCKRNLRLNAVGARQFEGHLVPNQLTLEPLARHIASRYAGLNWRILTPDGTADHRDGELTLSTEIHQGFERATTQAPSRDLRVRPVDLFSVAGLSVSSCLVDPE
ncbi:MAG: DUF4130 domain-containing protein [Flavimaricola sp.]|nr:DUF4130 domain-containing protein [Flavimaricola sp.]